MPGRPSPDRVHARIRPTYPQASPADLLMIGDTMADRDFAAASQIRFGLVEYGYGEVALRDDSASFKIHALSELPCHIETASLPG